MPAALSYTPEDKELRAEADKELLSRRTTCAVAWEYYDGKHKKQLRTKPGKRDYNVVINQWKQGKDREITFLFPKMPTFELDENSDVDSPDEKWLREAWNDNKGRKSLRRLAKYGAMCGHVFARVMPPKTKGGYPRVIALNPANVLVWWRADDYEEVLWYEVYYTMGGSVRRQDIVKDDGTWQIIEYEREKPDPNSQQSGKWKRLGEETWAYPLGPVVDWQHIDRPGRYYGDNEDSLLELQDSVNKVASDINKILSYYASPKRVIMSNVEKEKVTETAIEDAWLLPRESEVKTLEMTNDLASSVGFGQQLMDAMKAQQRVVVLTGSAADFQRVTNLGVQTVFIDQLAKTDELWEQYEPGIVALCKVMLMLNGMDWDRQIKVIRSSPLPTDPKETMDVQSAELEQGLVSKETIMRERGRNPQQERKSMEQEEEESATATVQTAFGNTQIPPNTLRPGAQLPPNVVQGAQ
jgi:hypothetical protein